MTGTDDTDPSVVDHVAVRATDLVAALEANRRDDGRRTVLRLTPPFSGRMRARLHQVADDDGAPAGLRMHAREYSAKSGVGTTDDPPEERDGPTTDDLAAESTDAGAAPVAVPPRALLASDLPDRPTPDGVADRLRTDPDEEYTVERHRERYADRLREWRARVPEHVRERARLPWSDDPVTIHVLGSWRP